MGGSESGVRKSSPSTVYGGLALHEFHLILYNSFMKCGYYCLHFMDENSGLERVGLERVGNSS